MADENEMNLRSLKQMDGTIDQIVMTCGQCAVYKFSNTSNEWERKEIEGSMFVVHRHTHNNYGFVVINRLNTTNMFQSIDHNFDINVNIPYLLYKNSLNEIFCIWFYDEIDCRRFSQELQNIVDRLSHENNHFATQSNSNPNDILKKLMHLDVSGDKSHPNGQNQHQNHAKGGHQSAAQSQPQPHPPHQPSHPLPQSQPSNPRSKKMSLDQLFQSHMGSQAKLPMPPIPTEAVIQNLEDPLLNDVITPAMLTNQSSRPNESPIVFNQSQQQPIQLSVNSPYNQNFVPLMVNKEKMGSVGVISMEQMKQTLIHLLQTDADFLHSIHNAYINLYHK